jgi:NAD(P)H-quinone oxidoreductase subunit 5
MDYLSVTAKIGPLLPAVLMCITALISLNRSVSIKLLWRVFAVFSVSSLIATIIAPLLAQLPSYNGNSILPWLITSPIQFWLALLVQLLGTIIGLFSWRYLQGELGQSRYIAAFSGVVAVVHLLLLADHWLLLIAAWAAIGLILQELLCFYPERPFAMLAAHKKYIADRIADVLLIAAAGLAWWEVGSGSLSALFAHIGNTQISLLMQLSAVLLVFAVMIRTALLPVHGWLIQVMEAPTPVSALLHAGVVNLSGFVLIRFATLLDAAAPARWLLVIFGLVTAVLAGLVLLTRISIKVKLAWSTVAQMGFMVLECGLGLYTLAAMHLLGHSLYKAHAFLSASGIVKQSKLQQLHKAEKSSSLSLILSPALTLGCIMLIQYLIGEAAWPWWWSVILALAWAPMLWIPELNSLRAFSSQVINGLAMITALTILALLLHHLPFGTEDMQALETGIFAMVGMTLMYITLLLLQRYPERLTGFQRWSYAGFYIDEAYTRLTLKLWPIDWASSEHSSKTLTAH